MLGNFSKFILTLLRIGMGWLMFYAGIVKVIDSDWTSVGYIANAKTFASFYQWLALPQNTSWVNFLNEWGLTLIGISLILGIFVRLSSIAGFLMMLLYYFPVLSFPYIAPHSYIVDEHVIYALVFLLLAALRAGRIFGLENWCSSLPICRRLPGLRSILG